MANPIKSSMLFSMINNYNQIKSDTHATIHEKQQLLNDILSLSDDINDPDLKSRVPLCPVKDNKPTSFYEAEEKIKQHGHEVLRLPSYHCDLNPIEIIWSLVKRKVSAKNLGVQGSQMNQLIIVVFESVTAADWNKYTDHVIHVENEYRNRDRISETELQIFINNVRDDESDSDTSFKVIEYLDSDLDYTD